jgi:hypothetical protein
MSTPRVGIVEQDDGRVAHHAAGEQRLLLVAAREIEDRVGKPLGCQREAGGPALGRDALGAEADGRETGLPGDAADGDVVEDAPEREDALAAPVARDEGGARGALRLATAGGGGCEEAAEERLLPATLEAGEADDLAGAQLDGSAERRGQRPGEAHQDGAVGAGNGVLHLGGRSATADGLDQVVERHVGTRAVGDDRAVAHGDDPVGDAEHLLQPVADEDHGEAVGRPAGDVGVERAGLFGGERRGRLVEDQEAEARVMGGPGDLEHLPFADVEPADPHVGIDADPGEHRRHAVAHGAAVGAEPEGRGAPVLGLLEEEVLGSREVGAEGELLVHDPDAHPVAGTRAQLGPGDGPATVEEAARIGLRTARQDAHQGGLAGTVRPDEADDLAGRHAERDVPVRPGGPVDLRDSFEQDERRRGRSNHVLGRLPRLRQIVHASPHRGDRGGRVRPGSW